MNNETILVVDDEREIADLLEVYLKNENYDVRKFYNPMDALAYVTKEPVGLAILDVKCFTAADALNLVSPPGLAVSVERYYYRRIDFYPRTGISICTM